MADNLCQIPLPNQQYRIIRHVSASVRDLYIFCGSQVPETIRQLLTKSSKVGTVIDKEVRKYFGDDFDFGLDETGIRNRYFLWNNLELDDSVASVKAKISVYLNIPILHQYLYIELSDSTPDSDSNPNHNPKWVALGHTLFSPNNDLILTPNPNPFKNIDLASQHLEGLINPLTGMKHGSVKRNDTNGMILQEYVLSTGSTVQTQTQTVHLVAFNDFMTAVNPNYHDVKLSIFQFGYLMQYWPQLITDNEREFLSDYSKMLSGKWSSQIDKEVQTRVQRDDFLVNLVKSPPSFSSTSKTTTKSEFQLSPCNILEIVFHVNYVSADQTGEFIDLEKVFDRFQLSEQIPFVKYRPISSGTASATRYARHRLYTPLTKTLPIQVIQEWMSTAPKREKINEDKDLTIGASTENKLTGKGLSFKMFLYQNKYATVNFFRDGKIEFKCFWEELKQATVKDAVEALKNMVKMIAKVNQIEYHLPNKNRQLRIPVPDVSNVFSSGDHLASVQIAFINTVNRIQVSNQTEGIDFNRLNDFASCFGAYVSVIKKNVIEDYDPELKQKVFKTTHSTGLQMRYKRINNYLQMSNVEKFIHDVVSQTEGLKRLDIAQLLSERFGISQDTADKIYQVYDSKQAGLSVDRKKKRNVKYSNLDFVLGRKIGKQPGIDVKVLGRDADNYKVFILGAKSLTQLSLIHRFIQSLFYLYANQAQVYKMPEFKGLCHIPEHSTGSETDADGIKESLLQHAALQKNAAKTLGAIELSEQEQSDLFDLLENDGDGDGDLESETPLEPIEEEGVDAEDKDAEADAEDKDEEEEKTTPLPSKKIKLTEADFKKKRNLLDYLKSADKEIFKTGVYATQCQSNSQPIVVDAETSLARQQDLKKQIQLTQDKIKAIKLAGKNTPDVVKQLTDLNLKITKLTEKLTIYADGVTYRNHHYMCPTSYEFQSERIPDSDEIGPNGLDTVTNNRVFIRGGLQPDKFRYAGFKHNAGEPFCAPCCFAKPKTKFSECLTETGTAQPTESKANPRYVYSETKAGLPLNRYGMLPKMLNQIFNEGKRSPNNITAPYDGYLRKGVSQSKDPLNFLNAIGHVITLPNSGSVATHTLTGQQIRDKIIKTLTPKDFMSLKGGTLQLVFSHGDDSTSPFENFKQFISHPDHIINEDLIWDLICKPKFLTEHGFNLIIFENQNLNKDTIMKCPIAFDLDELFQSSRNTAILLKYGTVYEPIVRIQDLAGSMFQIPMLSVNNSDTVELSRKLVSMMAQCQAELDTTAYANEAKLMKTIIKKYEPQISAYKTVQVLTRLNNPQFKPVKQIIDSYYKTIMIVVQSGLLIPVLPSSQITDLPMIGENEAPPPLGFNDTLQMLNELTQISSLPMKPLMALATTQTQVGADPKVVGIMVSCHLTIAVKPQSKGDFDPLPIPISYQYYDSRIAVDLAIQQASGSTLSAKLTGKPNATLPDDRLRYASLRRFENENYQRLRYEVSKYLIKHDDIRQKLNSKGQSRQQIYQILHPILTILTAISTTEIKPETYFPPNVRTMCHGRTQHECVLDPHCTFVASECHLYAKSTEEVSRYTALLTEELLRNPIRRHELLNDQVDNQADSTVFEHRQDEYTFNEYEGQDNRKKLDKLYQTKIDYYQRLAGLYDSLQPISADIEAHGITSSKIIKSSCQKNFEPLPTFWQTQLKNFKRLDNDSSTDCIPYALSLALNQLTPTPTPKTVSDVASIRSDLAEAISQLPAETNNVYDEVRPGWRLYLDHQRTTAWRDAVSHINTQDDLIDFVKSSKHMWTLIDLIIFARIYPVKVIIMDKSASPLNPKRFMCLGATGRDGSDIIVLYQHEINNFQLVADVSYDPPKYIFKTKDFPQPWWESFKQTCGSTDMKSSMDATIPLLQRVLQSKVFNVTNAEGKVITAKTYLTDPETGKIVSNPKPKPLGNFKFNSRTLVEAALRRRKAEVIPELAPDALFKIQEKETEDKKEKENIKEDVKEDVKEDEKEIAKAIDDEIKHNEIKIINPIAIVTNVKNDATLCQCVTSSGQQCSRKKLKNNNFCYQHMGEGKCRKQLQLKLAQDKPIISNVKPVSIKLPLKLHIKPKLTNSPIKISKPNSPIKPLGVPNQCQCIAPTTRVRCANPVTKTLANKQFCSRHQACAKSAV
jgi:hypothetical protein